MRETYTRPRHTRDDYSLAERLLDDSPSRLHHLAIPSQATRDHVGDDLYRQHGLDDEAGGPIGAERCRIRGGVKLARVQARREGELAVRVDGDAGGLLGVEDPAQLAPHHVRVLDPRVVGGRPRRHGVCQEQLRRAPSRRERRARLQRPENRVLGVLALAHLWRAGDWVRRGMQEGK